MSFVKINTDKIVLPRAGRSRVSSVVVQMILENMPNPGEAILLSKSEYATLRGDTEEQMKSNSYSPEYRELRNVHLQAVAGEFPLKATKHFATEEVAKSLGVKIGDPIFQIARSKVKSTQ